MKRRSHRPKWWRMDLIFVGMLLLIVLESLLPVPMWVDQILLAIVVLGGFGTVLGWLWANADSIQKEDDLRRDAETLKRDLPMTERQASYRLAMIRSHRSMRRDEPAHHRDDHDTPG